MRFGSAPVKAAMAIAAAAGLLSTPTAAFAQSEPYIGQIITFGGNFCPRGWASTEGQLLSIAQNTALFSLLGTTFGGNGQTTFALPDLRGRMVIAPGFGPGLSPRTLGEIGGAESTSLTVDQIASHAHGVPGVGTPETTTVKPTSKGATVEVLKALGQGSASTQAAGGGQAHNNMPPYLAVTTCIALEGIYPSRN